MNIGLQQNKAGLLNEKPVEARNWEKGSGNKKREKERMRRSLFSFLSCLTVLWLLFACFQHVYAASSDIPSWIKRAEEKAVKRRGKEGRRLAGINFKDSEYYSASSSGDVFNFTLVPKRLEDVLIGPESGNFSTVAGIYVEAQESSTGDLGSTYILYSINEPLSTSSKYLLKDGIITISTFGVCTLSFVVACRSSAFVVGLCL